MKSPKPADLARDDLGELRPAIDDVVFELTHDLSDTREDFRDAVAFAPIALVKTLGGLADYLATRPRRTLAVAGALLLVISFIVVARGKR